jgi:hypothetical protein
LCCSVARPASVHTKILPKAKAKNKASIFNERFIAIRHIAIPSDFAFDFVGSCRALKIYHFSSPNFSLRSALIYLLLNCELFPLNVSMAAKTCGSKLMPFIIRFDAILFSFGEAKYLNPKNS